MKKCLLFMVIALSMFTSACTNKAIEGGQVGVYVDKPWLFGHGGVREEVETTGRVLTWFSTEVWAINVMPQTFTVHVDDMMTENKVPLDFDIAVTIQPKRPQDASYLVRVFGGGPFTTFGSLVMPGASTQEKIVQNPSGEFMSYLRDKVRHYHMDEFMIGQTATGKMSTAAKDTEDGLRDYINKFLETSKAPIVVTNIALGRANPPDEVKSALARTAEQVQLKTTEEARKIAQDARRAAETASAIADKAYQTGLGLTPEQSMKKLELDTILKICGSSAKDLKDTQGKPNCTIIYGQALPMVPTTR